MAFSLLCRVEGPAFFVDNTYDDKLQFAKVLPTVQNEAELCKSGHR